jgi:putative membrane protein
MGESTMIRTALLACAATLVLGAPAFAQPAPVAMPMQRSAMSGDQMTTDFVTKAAQSDEFERREARLAEMRADNPKVKQFAAKMLHAHTETTLHLKSAIRKTGETPPPPPPLDDAQMKMMADLKGLHGPDFDKTYMDQQVQAHQEALGLMQTYAQNGQPGPIRNAAAKTVSVVQSHLDMAKDIQSHMGG